MIVGVVPTFVTRVYAADSMAGINCPTSVNEGEDFNVSLIIPESTVFGVQADVTLKLSDGTSTTQTIIYMGGYGEKSVTFNAKVAGQASVNVSNIIITDENSTIIEQGKTKSHSLTVMAKKVETPSTNGGTANQPETQVPENNTTNTGNENGSETNTTPKFTDVNEVVYTTTKCNVRKSFSTNSEKIATLSKNAKLTRTGIGDNGWSKVVYKEQTVYIYSEYLTTLEPDDSKEKDETEKPEEKEVAFKDTHENLYAKQNCNLRKSWSTDSEKVGYLVKGQAVERTGYADNGWSRIIYNGQTVYVASRLLVVEKPEEDKKDENVTNITNTTNTTNLNVVNETNEPSELTEEEKLKRIAEEVGVLPEVGNNIANVIFVIVTMLAIAIVFIGVYYLKNK